MLLQPRPDSAPVPTIERSPHAISEPDCFPLLRPGNERALSFRAEGWQFDYFCAIRSVKRLIVLLPSAQRFDRRRVPYFSRATWHTDFDCSVLAVNDPTLYLSDELLGGWFQGTSENLMIPLIAHHVDGFAQMLGIERNDIVFAGSSIGGFAALLLAAELPGTKCYVEMPQIEFQDYCVASAKALVAKHCYGCTRIEDIDQIYRARISVISNLVEKKMIPSIYYVQKISNKHHLERPAVYRCLRHRLVLDEGVQGG